MTRHVKQLVLLACIASPLATRGQVPVIDSLVASATTARPGDSIALTVSATGPAGRTLSYAWSVSPLGCGTFSTTTAPSTTLKAVIPGTCTVKAKVKAGTLTTSRTVAITILPLDPPVITSLQASATTVPAGALVTLTAAATDAAGRPLSYAWTASPAGCGTFSTTTAPSTTLTAVVAGTCTAKITVKAGTQSVSRSVAITITAVSPPVVTSLLASATTAFVGDLVALTASARDAAGRPLSYAWTASPAGCGTFSTTTAPSTTLTAAIAGTCTARITVRAGNQSASKTVRLTILPASPPVISELAASPLMAYPGDAISLSVSAIDTAGRALSYAWSVSPLECGAFSSVDTASTTLTAAAPGTCAVTATVTAGSQSASLGVSITIQPMDAPIITALLASAATAVPGDVVSLGVLASDPLGRPLAYSWSAEPLACGTFSATDGPATDLTAAALGTCTVTASVAADGQSASWSVGIAIRPPGPPPPAAMPRVAHSYTVMNASGATTPAAAVAGLGPAVAWWSRAGDTAAWDGNAQDGYDMRIAKDPASNVPTSYVIEASSDGGTSWTPLVTVSGNTYLVRGHLVDLTGYSMVRMRLTGAPFRGGVGTLGTDFAVHDARGGHDDWWIALGDSLTTNVWNVADSIKFGTRVHAADARWFPVAEEGGVSGAYIADFLRTDWTGNPDGRPIFQQWMADFPGTYVILAIGQNDANAGTNIDRMEADFRRLLDLVVAAGKIPVVPTLRWTYTNGATSVANIQAWNARLVSIRASYPTCITGPDVYTRAAAQGLTGLLADRTHLNQAGVTLTQEDWLLWAMASVYVGP